VTTAIEHLEKLVAFPTHQAGADGRAGDERPLCEHLAPLLRARGADEVVVGAGRNSDGREGAYVFARWGRPVRIINAHVDTVPANAGWSSDPWQPRIAGGRLYGLGSADTKGAIAAALVALDGKRPVDRGVLFSGDEEAGSGVLRAFFDSPHARAIEEVIVCEPTARTAGVSHRGVLGQRATLTGPGGHSSKADHLPKPLAQLARLATALDDAGIRRRGDGPPGMTGTCLNIASLTGGVAFNVIPGRAELEWSLRPYPGFDRAGWDREVDALVRAVDGPSRRPEAALRGPAERGLVDPGIEVSTTIDHGPFACDALAELVRPFVRSVGPLDFWTEAALWSDQGKRAIVIGPGDIALAHGADEYVPLEDLDWAVELFRALL
jgi:acetylornithine deacetylase